jgi:hypothetical protein
LIVELLVEGRRGEGLLGLARALDQLADAGDDLAAAFVAEFDGRMTSSSVAAWPPASTMTIPCSVAATTMFSLASLDSS